MRWLVSLIFFLAQLSSAQSVIFPGPGNAAGGGAGGSFGTISLVKNFTGCWNGSAVSSQTSSLGGTSGASPCSTTGAINATAGDIVVAVIFTAGSATVSSISDTFGDANGWTECSTPQTSNGTAVRMLYWKQVGTVGTPGSTVTVNLSAANGLRVDLAEFATTSGNFSLDGTPTNATNAASTNPDPGAITTTSTSSLVIGYVDSSVTPTVGTGYTLGFGNFWNNADYEEYKITTSSGSYDPNWTSASASWGASACAFKAN